MGVKYHSSGINKNKKIKEQRKYPIVLMKFNPEELIDWKMECKMEPVKCDSKIVASPTKKSYELK